MTDIRIVKTVILLIIAFFIISLVVAFLKKESDNIRRALIFGLIFGALYLALDLSKIDRLTWSEIKLHLFPPDMTEYPYTVDVTTFQNATTTHYIFEENLAPTISLTLDSNGKYLDIIDIAPVNSVLVYLGLKKVFHGVPELASITGSHLNVNQYRWDDYPGGVLTIERTLCRDKNSLTTRQCIASVTVVRR